MFFFNSRVQFKHSGVLTGITDMHSHLLPCVDDGVQKTEESLEVLGLLEVSGVREVWLTPHIMEDVPNKPEQLKERFNSFRGTYIGNIVLHLAAENMLDCLFMERLAARQLLTHNFESLLVETSYSNPPMGLKHIFEDICSAGYRPLLAHPERYRYMDMDDYEELKEMGVNFQLNMPSLVGAYGIDAFKKAEYMLTKGMYDCFGSDLHSLRQLHYLLESKISRKHVKMLEALKCTHNT